MPRVRQSGIRTAGLILIAALTVAVVPPAALAQTATPVVPLTISRLFVQNGQLYAQATMTVKSQSTSQVVPIALASTPSGDPSCPVLNLSLAPINLNLLGLQVTTSQICLQIAGQRGQGNLLGNLVCTLANLLNHGNNVAPALQGLSNANHGLLLTGLTTILNNVLGQLLSNTASAALSAPTAPACTILNLSVGPLALNLLGLQVNLDNCAGGPVTATITAITGAGNLLGNLLCSLVSGLGTPPTAATVIALLQQALASL
jgi:hypothetical protein